MKKATVKVYANKRNTKVIPTAKLSRTTKNAKVAVKATESLNKAAEALAKKPMPVEKRKPINQEMEEHREELGIRLQNAIMKLPELQAECESAQWYDLEEQSIGMEEFINAKMDSYINQLAIIEDLKRRINNMVHEMLIVKVNRGLTKKAEAKKAWKERMLDKFFGRDSKRKLEDQASTGNVAIYNRPQDVVKQRQAELQNLFAVDAIKVTREFVVSPKWFDTQFIPEDHLKVMDEITSGRLTYDEVMDKLVKLNVLSGGIVGKKLKIRDGQKALMAPMPHNEVCHLLNLPDEQKLFGTVEFTLLGKEPWCSDMKEIEPSQLTHMRNTFKKYLNRYLKSACDQRLGLVDENGQNLRHWSVSPSQQKLGKAYYMERQAAKIISARVWMGLTPKKIAAKGGILMAKFWQYRALLCTTTSRAQVQEDCKIKPENILVLKAIKAKKHLEGIDYVSDHYDTELNVSKDVVDKDFDGQLNQWLMPGFQARLADKDKGFCAESENPVWWCFEHNVLPIIPGKFTLDGKDFDLRDHPEITGITTEDFAKSIKLYESTDEYVHLCQQFEINEMPVCAVSHKDHKARHTSRQILSACWWMTDSDIMNLVTKTIDTFNKRYHDPVHAMQYMQELEKAQDKRSAFARLLAADPTFANTYVFESIMSECAKSDWNAAMAGNYELDAAYMFFVKEPNALWEILFQGKAPEEAGKLKAGECCVPDRPDVENVVLARHPLLADDCLLPMKNVQLSEYAGQHVCIVGWKGLSDRVVDGDHDGDEVLVIFEHWFYTALIDAINKYQIRPLIFDAVKLPDDLYAELYAFPQTAEAYADMAVRTMRNGYDNNMIGKYSNWAGAMLGLLSPDLDEAHIRAYRFCVNLIRVAASQAVDAQKTGYMVRLTKKTLTNALVKQFGKELGEEVAKTCWSMGSKLVYSQRYKEWTRTTTDSETGVDRPLTNEEWDELTLPQGNGAVDRASRLFASLTECKFDADMSVYGEFSLEKYAMPCGLRKSVCTDMVRDLILNNGKRTEYNEDAFTKIENGEAVGMRDKAELLFGVRKGSIDECFSDVENEDALAVAKHKDILDAKLKKLLLMETNPTKEGADAEELAAMWLFNWCMNRHDFASEKAMAYWARMAQWIIKMFAKNILSAAGSDNTEDLPSDVDQTDTEYESVEECW